MRVKMKQMKKSLALKLILSFLLTATLSIAALSLYSVFRVEKNGRETLANTSRLALQNTYANIVNVLESADKASYLVYNNPGASALLWSDHYDYSDIVSVTKQVNNQMLLNPWLLSVSLYNGKRITYRNANDVYFHEDDQEVVEVIKNGSVLTPVLRKVKSQNKEFDIITVTYYEMVSESGAVILNLDAEILREAIFSDYTDPMNAVYLLDATGNILLGNQPELFMENIAGWDYISEILNRKEEYTGKRIRSEGNTLYLNTIYDSERNLFLVLATNYYNVSGRLNAMTKPIIIMSLLLCCVIAIVVLLVSRKYYFPIQNTFTNIRQLAADKFSDRSEKVENKNEIQFAYQTIQKTIDRLNHSLLQKQNQYLKEILFSESSLSEGKLRNDLAEFLIFDIFKADYLCAVFKTDDNTGMSEGLPISLAESFATRISGAEYQCCYLEVNNHAILFIQLPEKKNIYDLAALLSEINREKKGITIGLSESCTGVLKLKQSYENALEATNYRLYQDLGEVILYADIAGYHDKISKVDSSGIDKEISNMVKCVIKMQETEFDRSGEALFKLLQHYNYQTLIYILSKSVLSIYNIPALQPFLEEIDRSLPVYDRLVSCHSFEEVQQYYREIYWLAISHLSSANHSGAGKLVHDAIEYIRSHYFDSMISSTLIAEKLSITPQYFSNIFKAQMQMSFPEYLNTLRLEKAEDLLKEFAIGGVEGKNLKIDEICIGVGYNDKRYFSNLFKKKYGLLPLQYYKLFIQKTEENS